MADKEVIDPRVVLRKGPRGRAVLTLLNAALLHGSHEISHRFCEHWEYELLLSVRDKLRAIDP